MLNKLMNNKTINDMILNRKRASLTDLLGEGVTINGTYTSEKNVRVVGSIEGDLKVEGNVYIDEKGRVNGNVYACDIDISGTVCGDLVSSGKVQVRDSAVISGCLYTRALEIEANAVVEGAIYMADHHRSPELKRSGAVKKEKVQSKQAS